MDNTIANRAADNIRILSAAMVEKAKSGHPGGAMGGADFINILYSEFLVWDPQDMTWTGRDRFFLDPGHMSPMLYSQLTLTGNFSLEEIAQFRQWESPTPGHPEVDVKRGIENTSGPLGQGHTMAVGAAIAAKFLKARFGDCMDHKIYTYISDGGVQEEISQGAGRIAGYLGLNNLIMFYDSNDIQLSTETKSVTCEDTAKKYAAWGRRVINIDGNNADQIRTALRKAILEKEKPTIIIGKTIMGKGAMKADGSSFERMCATHGMPLGESGASYEKSIENLGGDPHNAFVIFPEVAEYYKGLLKKKHTKAMQKKNEQKKWAKENAALSEKLAQFFSGKAPQLDYTQIKQKADNSTRAASAEVLGFYAKNVENMIVMSADLSNSDKTDGFLKHTKAFTKGDFSGSFLQMGVCELTMASIANGMALHGGVIAACATFFVFSDYMKPAVRLAALMRLPVKYVWTHDAFRVGEDGPTHQPVEQEAQIRLMEWLYNHHGERSTLVLRPADSIETTTAWKMAMDNHRTPTALILSRQNIKDIPALPNSDRYTDALNIALGAYIVRNTEGTPDLVLVANGSEVATLVEAANKLQEKGLKVQIVSAPSEAVFRDQDEDYQNQVLPVTVPTLGLTAGLPLTLRGLVGPFGKVIGLDHFGQSAPYKILDQKFGFTPDNVVNVAEEYLKNYKH